MKEESIGKIPLPHILVGTDEFDRALLIETIIKYSRLGLHYAKESSKKNTVGLIHKDVEWLWRTAYNLAVDLSVSSEREPVTRLFEISRDVRLSFPSIPLPLPFLSGAVDRM